MLDCVRGCPDYLRTKGNQQERQQLIQLQTNTEQALTFVQQQVDQTTGTLAHAWVKHHQETLQGLRWALAVDEDETRAEGQLVSPASLTMTGAEHGTQQ